MLKSLPLIVLGLSLAACQTVSADDDDLFSDVRVDSVYESESGSATPRKRTVSRVKDSDDLQELVRKAGFEPKVTGSRIVTTTKKLEPWSFPVLITLAEDEKHLGIVLALSSVDADNQVTTEQLLKLLDANRKYAPSQFSFSASRKRTELFFLLKNEDVTGDSLRDEINRLAILAKETEGIWKIGEAAEAEASAEQAADSPTPKPLLKSNVESKAVSLTGRWSAARSATEAFAIEFKDDGTFVLVYVKDGQQTRSTGKFSSNAGQLSLEGDGLQLSGKLVSQSDKEFQFQPKNSTTALTFKKAN